MSLYRRAGSKTWTYEFVFKGQRIQESSGTRNKDLARTIERNRRTELEEGTAGVIRSGGPKLFAAAAQEYLSIKESTLGPKSLLIEKLSVRHLNEIFAKQLLPAITAKHVSDYQKLRLAEEAAPKSINLEVGTLRAILRRAGVWQRVQADVKMLATSDEVGRALSDDEADVLLLACRASASPALFGVVMLALYTGARYGTIQKLRWKQVDFENRCLRWGKDKTATGTGRVIPLNQPAFDTLTLLARDPHEAEHYIFQAKRVLPNDGEKGIQLVRTVSNPNQPIGQIKTAWETAKAKAGVILAGGKEDAPALQCRFHDLRHTACSRMLGKGAPLVLVAKIMGWSASTMVAMAKRYSHFDLESMRACMEKTSIPAVPAKVPAPQKVRKVSARK